MVPALRWPIKCKLLVLGIALLPLLCLVAFWAYWEGTERGGRTPGPRQLQAAAHRA